MKRTMSLRPALVTCAIVIALAYGSPEAFAQTLAQDTSVVCPGAKTITIGEGDTAQTFVACADPAPLAGICNYVYQKFRDREHPGYKYLYQYQVDAAAGVNRDADSMEVRRAKLRHMWSTLEDPHLKCDGPNFNVQNGSILKYAIRLENSYFLSQAVETWNVDINTVDRNDGLTVLDYVREEIRKAAGTDTAEILRVYEDMLVEAGALRCRELPVERRGGIECGAA